MRDLTLPVLLLFTVSLGYGLLVPLLPELAGGADVVPEATLAVVFVAFSAARLACLIPGGLAVDRWGSGRVLRLAMPLYTLSFLGFLTGSIPAMALARLLEGGAAAMVDTAVLARVASGDPDRAGRRLGLVGGLGMTGMLVGPVVGAGAGAVDPTRAVLLAMAIAALASIALWTTPLRPLPARAAASLRVRLSTLATTVRSRAFVALTLPVWFNKLAFTATQALLPLLATRFEGVGGGTVAALYVAMGVGFGVVQPVAGWLADRITPRLLLLGGGPPLVLALLAMGSASTLSTFLSAFAAWVLLGSFVFTVNLKAAVTRWPEAAGQGGRLGGWQLVTDTGTIIGPALFLPAWAVWDTGVFVGMAALGAAVYLGYLLLTRSSSPTVAVVWAPS